MELQRQWRAAALLNTTQIDGEVVSEVNSVRASGQKFYAQFTTDNGWILAEYANGTWRTLVRRGDVMPNGGTIYYLNRTDAGDIFNSYQNFSLSLRDDRKIYFTGIDILDRNLLYLAEPLF